MEENKQIMLDGNTITLEQLQEKMQVLKPGERIVESTPGKYETISRLHG